MKPIALIGFMGSGKSTTGKKLAEKLNRPFMDMDHSIEEHMGLSIPDLFEQFGEEEFRKQESQLLKEMANDNQIVSTGGGIIKHSSNREVLSQRYMAVFLKLEFDSVLKRLGDDQSRPLWQLPFEQRLELFMRRQPLYEQVSQCTIVVDSLTKEEVVEKIISHLNL